MIIYKREALKSEKTFPTIIERFFRFIKAMVVMGVGLGIFGWGPIACMWIFSQKKISISDFLGAIALTVPFYLCCVISLSLLTSISLRNAKPRLVFIILGFYLAGIYMLLGSISAISNRQMEANAKNIIFIIIFCLGCFLLPPLLGIRIFKRR